MKTRLLLLVPVLGIAACSGDRAVRCEDNTSYRSAYSIAPLRIPDDLSVPDESDAIRVPPPPASRNRSAEPEPGRCLEHPPDFFEGGRGA